MALGADGVQIGSRFAASVESSAHQNFKVQIINAKDGATKLSLKKLVPVRLIRNKFLNEFEEAENRGASKDELLELLGRGRAKKGMFEGDVDEGELEIGQVSANINEIISVEMIMEEIINDFHKSKSKFDQFNF